jgi:adenylyl-sulfate kinase
MLEDRLVTKVIPSVSRAERCVRNGHGSGVLWLTGLSGAGKSTLAMAASRMLFESGFHTYVLDGDNLRAGLTSDLNFSKLDRAENIRRAAEVSALVADSGAIVLAAFISPMATDRQLASQIVRSNFHEVYIRASLSSCEKRDPKGLYRLARAGKIQSFTGVSAPYEPPEAPSLTIDTNSSLISQSTDMLVAFVRKVFLPQDRIVRTEHCVDTVKN